MQSSDRKPFALLLAETYEYYGKALSEFLIGVFWDGLCRFDYDDVRRAFSVHAQDPDRGQFLPRIADITRVLEGSTGTQGMRAWAKVEPALRCVGSYQTVVFDDPLIHAVIDGMGGWVKLCQTPTDELPFRARDFERSYAAYRQQRERPAFPARLIGIIEGENVMRNFEGPRPILIGDPARAMKVLEHGGANGALRITQAGDIAVNALRALSNNKDRDTA